MRDTRVVVLTEAALSIALAIVLNWVSVTANLRLPQGGTVSLALLPLVVFALRRGPIPATMAGLAFGALNYYVEPFVVHWVQFFLDYPLAWLGVGVAGLFASRSTSAGRTSPVAIIMAVLVASLFRYVAHVTSGVVFFADYAEGSPVITYSLIYNLYVWASAAVVLGAAMVVVPALDRAVPAAPATQAS